MRKQTEGGLSNWPWSHRLVHVRPNMQTRTSPSWFFFLFCFRNNLSVLDTFRFIYEWYRQYRIPTDHPQPHSVSISHNVIILLPQVFNGLLSPHWSSEFYTHFYSRLQDWRTRNYQTLAGCLSSEEHKSSENRLSPLIPQSLLACNVERECASV